MRGALDRCWRPEARTNCQRRRSGPQSVVRHSVDFGLPVTLMTQVVSCRLLIARSVRKLLPPKCKLNRDFNAALLFRNSTVRWQRACLDNNRKGASGARSQGSPSRGLGGRKLPAFHESNGAELRNCRAYIREWVTKEGNFQSGEITT